MGTRKIGKVVTGARARQREENARIQSEFEAQSIQRNMAEQLIGKRKARSRASVGLLSPENLATAGKTSETLG